MSLFWIVSNILCIGPLVITIINVLTWSRGKRQAAGALEVSVLIPARNEASNIEQCVRAVLANDYPVREVIVYDDQSTDQTAEIVKRLAGQYRHVQLINGEPLPPRWVGKPHACQKLAAAARGAVLLFLDADTFLEANGITRLMSLLEPKRGRRADLVTAFPRQIMQSAVERWMIPLLALTYTSWFPLFMVAWSRSQKFLAANGQVLMIRRSRYDDIGGFAAVAQEIVDDMALCRLAKQSGSRVVFADGFEIARCRMYSTASGVWSGFTKNLYEGIGETPLALVVVLALYGSVFVWPYVAFALALFGLGFGPVIWPGCGVAANLLIRALLAARFSHPWSSVWMHPIAVVALMALAIHSFWLNATNAVTWRGRIYSARRNRIIS